MSIDRNALRKSRKEQIQFEFWTRAKTMILRASQYFPVVGHPSCDFSDVQEDMKISSLRGSFGARDGHMITVHQPRLAPQENRGE